MSERVNDEGTLVTAVAGGEDRIGALPDELLHHLMSFLLSRDAVRTCVLAKRWRTLWKSVPALRIRDPESYASATGSSTFVDQLIRHRGSTTPLDVCEIFSESEWLAYEDAGLAQEAFRHMFPWLQYAACHQVKVLTVSFSLLVTDMTIVSSHLKKLRLCHMLLGGCSLDFSSCPVLEVLELDECFISGDIVSQSLRHLSIDGGFTSPDTRTRVSTPNLVCFELAYHGGFIPLLDSMPALVKASVKLELLCEEEDSCYCDPPPCRRVRSGSSNCSVVLEGLPDVTNLELTAIDHVFVFRTDLEWCPMFGKLKKLLLNDWCLVDNFIGLVFFLQHSPVLETLMLQLGYSIRKPVIWTTESYNSREQPLLSKNLKVVKIIRDMWKDVRIHHIFKVLSAHGVPSEKIEIEMK